MKHQIAIGGKSRQCEPTVLSRTPVISLIGEHPTCCGNSMSQEFMSGIYFCRSCDYEITMEEIHRLSRLHQHQRDDWGQPIIADAPGNQINLGT